MANCASCGSTIVVGGVTQSGLRFCGKKCAQNSALLVAAQSLPPDLVEQQVRALFQAACPKCGGEGPVDIRFNHRITSALYLTWWKTKSSVSCAKCAKKEQWGAIAHCMILGWWGFPWGIVGAPVQIGRNVSELLKAKSTEPSEALRLHVRRQLAANPPAEGVMSPYLRVPGAA